MVEFNSQAMQVQHTRRLQQYNQQAQPTLVQQQHSPASVMRQAASEAALEAHLAQHHPASAEVLAVRQRLQQQQAERKSFQMNRNPYYKDQLK